MEDNKIGEFEKTIFEQHLELARNAVNERLMLTNIFAIIFAGSLAIIKDNLFELSSLPLFFFLLVLSGFGIFFSLKMASIINIHTYSAKNMLNAYNLFDMWDQYEENWVNNKIRISRLFPIFFSICFYFIFSILIYTLFSNYYLWSFINITTLMFIIIPILLLFITIICLYRLKFDQFNKFKK